MGDESDHTTRLLRLAEEWENLAREARQWVKGWQPGDLPPTYLQGCADQLETNARQLRALVEASRSVRRHGR